MRAELARGGADLEVLGAGEADADDEVVRAAEDLEERDVEAVALADVVARPPEVGRVEAFAQGVR
ncbi:MAG: hypothetical protein IPK80_00715 [Nannocystis sp.]|nr:hypothetical protein [Nannocystis sp.]